MGIPTFVMMVGLVGAGKTYKAQELAKQYDAKIFSSDALREELFNDINEQSRNQELFTELHKRIKNCLRDGKSAIYDATNINYKKRMSFLAELKNIPCEKTCVLMATPYEECLKRNTERERKVPEYVIERMYRNFNIPYWFEGWDDIQIEYGDYYGYYGHPITFYDSAKYYNQNNSHHALTLGEHCKETCIALSGTTQELVFAGVLHDCGKPFCATNINKKGEVTEEIHYYDHQNVGGYKSLFYQYEHRCNPIDVAILVNLHMQPYFNKEEKTKEKYRRLWGEKLYQDIMQLHTADKEAH